MNVGECEVCPIGARYSPNHHLQLALATGRCRLLTRVAVRRVVTDGSGRARAVVVRALDESADREHPADVVVIAAAAIESARLLLLSKDARHPDGLGNSSGHVGRHLVFHHIWSGHVHYRDRLFPGKVGFWTGQSNQFCDPPTRGRHGGMKIEFSSMPWNSHPQFAGEATTLDDAMRRFEITLHCRQVAMHAESAPTPQKFVALSRETDRFGDPVAHVQYQSDAFDRRTYEFSRELFERVAKASGGYEWEYREANDFATFAHHMGTCRMSAGPADGVVDSFGAVHDTPGLFVVGLSGFVGAGGAVNPTLTGVALALRSADSIAERLG
jgi:choline dehydrogenase-like flavoprotein